MRTRDGSARAHNGACAPSFASEGANTARRDHNAPSTGYPAQTGNPYAQVPEAPYTPPQQGGGYTPGSYAVSTPGYANTPKGNGAGGSFWDQLSATNSILTELEQKIQAVKQAQLASLVSLASIFFYRRRRRPSVMAHASRVVGDPTRSSSSSSLRQRGRHSGTVRRVTDCDGGRAV